MVVVVVVVGYDLMFKRRCVRVCALLIDRRKRYSRFVILRCRQWGPVGNERAVVSIARKQEFRGAREYTGEQLYIDCIKMYIIIPLIRPSRSPYLGQRSARSFGLNGDRVGGGGGGGSFLLAC